MYSTASTERPYVLNLAPSNQSGYLVLLPALNCSCVCTQAIKMIETEAADQNNDWYTRYVVEDYKNEL